MSSVELHGADPSVTAGQDYEVPDEYAQQGDTRVIRALRFLYTVGVEDASGNVQVHAVEAFMGEEVTLEQIGLLSQMKGEESHAFYTTEERARIESGGNPDVPMLTAGSNADDVSALGEYELSEYIKGANPDGKELTVNETVALAGNDKDLAHRLLQAENIATDGEPRKGVEAGLTAIIEG
jgi:hypothetical protein